MIAFNFRDIGVKAFFWKSSALRLERHPSSRSAFSGVVLSLALLGLSHTHPLQVTRHLIFEAAHQTQAIYERPLQAFTQEIHHIANYFKNQEKLLEEVFYLRQQNENLLKWQAHAQQLAEDQKVLQQHLKIPQESPWPQMTAKVIGVQTYGHGDYLIIAAGEIQGIQKNHPVITPEGLLGRVVETGLYTSRILRLTDLNSRIPVKIVGQDVDLMLSGSSPTLLEVTRQAQQINFEMGHLLVTSGRGGVYPAGIPVAQIVSCDQGQVLAKPLTSTSPDYVTILMAGGEHVS